MSDKEDQLPIFLALSTPARHPGKTNAVLDDAQKLPVSKTLRVLLPHVGRRRVESGVDLGSSTPVVGVADGAMVRKMISSLREV